MANNDGVKSNNDDGSSLRDAIEAAFKEHERAAEPKEAEPVKKTSEKPLAKADDAEPKAGVTPDDEPKRGAGPSEPEKAEKAAEPGETKPEPTKAEPEPPVEPPPASWRPEERTEWAKLPPSARAAVLRRESEIARAMQQSADARTFAKEFEKVVEPYKLLFARYGVSNPLSAIDALLQTRAALELGTPDQKAQLVANIVHNFGVDIEKLDAALVAPRPAAPPTPPPMPDYRSDPQLAPLFSLAEAIKERQRERMEKEMAEVERLPHFEELRDSMADIIEAASKNGRRIGVRQAYDAALALRPDLKPATPQPSSAPATPPSVSEAAAILARSRTAASSVAGAPKGSPRPQPQTLREELEAAYDEMLARGR
ncbi:MAG: hypothetical protein NZ534_00075 [Bacteroidia bacterium]|nr:hypothetical protein [Bacteroidia bacterium]